MLLRRRAELLQVMLADDRVDPAWLTMLGSE